MSAMIEKEYQRASEAVPHVKATRPAANTVAKRTESAKPDRVTSFRSIRLFHRECGYVMPATSTFDCQKAAVRQYPHNVAKRTSH